MDDRIRGAVAQILNRRELVINVGADSGVAEGMRFAVLNRRGLEVKDPDTGDVLGSVDRPKVLVEVVRVQPRLSIARTFRSRRKNVGGGSFALEFFGTPAKWIKVPETLQLEDKPYEEELDEQQSYVKIGDPVVQVVADEFLSPADVALPDTDG